MIAKLLGVHSVVQKPYDADELCAAVDAANPLERGMTVESMTVGGGDLYWSKTGEVACARHFTNS